MSVARSRLPRTTGCLLVAVVLVVVAAIAGVRLLGGGKVATIPAPEGCVATAAGASVDVDLDQAHYAAIITGVSVRRGLPPRAASIALATALTESKLRNLSYGDRDSVGLFQQRPSQGWGTRQQLLDPYYAANAFYDALVKVSGWRTRGIGEVAQQVQRSGYPDAYLAHETEGRILASTLSGQSPGGFTCLDRSGHRGDGSGLRTGLRDAFGRISVEVDGTTVTVRPTPSSAADAARAWGYASFAVAGVRNYGVTAVSVAGRRWVTGSQTMPAWTDPSGGSTSAVVITVR